MLPPAHSRASQTGLIARKVYAQMPPKVEYSPTPRGRSLEPVITALKVWAMRM
ncbi:hypothetical protein X736_17015 [Mesorhizobium sp. L2C089B000]|nr:hypothetical protein X736_17015 [Mesorhizobium sp. L2C089B000]